MDYAVCVRHLRLALQIELGGASQEYEGAFKLIQCSPWPRQKAGSALLLPLRGRENAPELEAIKKLML
jgi:hypothetical protein